MKKLILGLASLFLLFVICVSPVGASTQDFTIKDFQADYYLDKDNNGFATLKTVERITATFPNFDQNHGITRSIPTKYNDHTLDLNIQSVKNDLGDDINYSKLGSSGELTLRIGDADRFVYGDNIYVITYTQKYVVKSFEKDEFYWDINGNGWPQSFSNVTARLHLGDNISDSFTGDLACYYGLFGSKNKCEISMTDGIVNASVADLGSHEGMSIVAGFKKGTFKDYVETVFDFLAKNIVFIESIVLAILLIVLLIIKVMFDRSEPGRTTIIAEYLPPKDMDIPLIANLYCNNRAWVAATLIDLVVRRNVKMIRNEKSGLFGRGKYTIELVSLDGLSYDDRHFLQAFFKSVLTIGDQYKMGTISQDNWLASSLRDTKISANSRANSDGYYINRSTLHRNMTLVTLSIVAQALIAGYFLQYENSFQTIMVISLMTLVFGLSITYFGTPFSKKGSECRDYIKGLKLYIKTAEADRLKILQSPTGAQGTVIDTTNKRSVINLYEKLLPFAILFGLEKNWSSVLGEYYNNQNTSPDWYSSNRPFEINNFTRDISGFSLASAATAASYSSSSSSSSSGSSGFSSGGGFSGGGGGGGGGGGW